MMASSLRDDLASLKIERKGAPRVGRSVRVERGLGVRLLSTLLWLIPLTLLVAAGTAAYWQIDKIRPRPVVSVGLVQAMTIGQAETLLSAKGYVKSHSQAMIGAKMPGRVESMYVEEGMKVEKGQVLAVLEHNDMKAQLESRKAMLARSRAELAEARADLALKERRARRYTMLQERGTASSEEIEDYLFDRDMASSRADALSAAIDLQQAMLQETEETIANMHIIAPFSGTVVAKEAEVGETITPGGMGAASGRGSVVTLADLDQLEVETDIAENLLARVVIGQPAEISVSAVPGRSYRGVLRRIIPLGDRTRGTIKVDVEILDPDEKLFPELVATVHFLPDKNIENPDAGRTFLFVPKVAILEEGGHTHVWVLEPDGSLRKQRVEVVVSTDDLARVEKGLEAGQSVILNPDLSLKEGMLVQAEN